MRVTFEQVRNIVHYLVYILKAMVKVASRVVVGVSAIPRVILVNWPHGQHCFQTLPVVADTAKHRRGTFWERIESDGLIALD